MNICAFRKKEGEKEKREEEVEGKREGGRRSGEEVREREARRCEILHPHVHVFPKKVASCSVFHSPCRKPLIITSRVFV